MSKRKHTESSTTISPSIFESTPIHDRSSTFTAIFSPSTTSPHSLQRHAPFESASHKILAWRKPSGQRSIAGSLNRSSDISSSPSNSSGPTNLSQSNSSVPPKVLYETGSDDDGEKYAGKKLEKVLTDLDVQGTVVVARWYGGVLLGPVRFKWIEDSAREAVLKWKISEGGSGVAKKVKVDEGEDETKQTARLIRVLRERDANIVVLRGLLAEKNEALSQVEAASNTENCKEGISVDVNKQKENVKSPIVATVDYESMPLQRLKQMEKARDATLAWILRQIDVVEEKTTAPQKTENRF